MASNPNTVTLTGNLTRDPEFKITGAGTNVLSFSIANNRSYKDRNDEWVEETSYFDVVAWAKLAEEAAEILEKGMRVIVVGRAKQDNWTDKETGENRSKVGFVADEIALSASGLASVERKQRNTEGAAPRSAPKRTNVPTDDPF